MYDIVEPRTLSKRAWVANAVIGLLSAAADTIAGFAFDTGVGATFDWFGNKLDELEQLNNKRDIKQFSEENRVIFGKLFSQLNRHIQVARYLASQFAYFKRNFNNINEEDLLKWFSSNATVTDEDGELVNVAHTQDIQIASKKTQVKKKKWAPFTVVYGDYINSRVNLPDFFNLVHEVFGKKKKEASLKKEAIVFSGVAGWLLVNLIFFIAFELALRVPSFVEGVAEDASPEELAKAIMDKSKNRQELEKIETDYLMLSKQYRNILTSIRDMLRKFIMDSSGAAEANALSFLENNTFYLNLYPNPGAPEWQSLIDIFNKLRRMTETKSSQPRLNYFMRGVITAAAQYDAAYRRTQQQLLRLITEYGTKERPTALKNMVKIKDKNGQKTEATFVDGKDTEVYVKRAKDNFKNMHKSFVALIEKLRQLHDVAYQTSDYIDIFSGDVIETIQRQLGNSTVSFEGGIEIFPQLKNLQSTYEKNVEKYKKKPMHLFDNPEDAAKWEQKRKERDWKIFKLTPKRRLYNELDKLEKTFKGLEAKLMKLYQAQSAVFNNLSAQTKIN